MKKTHNNFGKLEKKLKAAYQLKNSTTGSANEKWRQNVMRSIRQLGPINQKTNNRFGFSQLSWRLAPIALALMVILSVLIFQVKDDLEYKIASQLVRDPVQSYMIYEPL